MKTIEYRTDSGRDLLIEVHAANDLRVVEGGKTLCRGSLEPIPDAYRAAPSGSQLTDRHTHMIDAKMAVRDDAAPMIEAAIAAVEVDLDAAADALGLEPIGYNYEIGCDVADRHGVAWSAAPEGTPYPLIERARRRHPLEIPDISRWAPSAQISEIAERLGSDRIEATMCTYGGWRLDRRGLDLLIEIAAARQAEAQGRAAERREALLAEDVPAEALAAYRECGGDPERMEDDIDNPGYWLVRRWADAIEAQGLAGINAVHARKLMRSDDLADAQEGLDHD
jgi:hypothetical protein